jgi:8-oxo-dGTP diphosphatase
LIRRNKQVLLINKEKPTWMGRWNGVGGKIEKGETPKQNILREIQEETTIQLHDVTYKGVVTWSVDHTHMGGMYLFDKELPENYTLQTPFKNKEGIVDWKAYDWVLHRENKGIADTLPYYFPIALKSSQPLNHHFVFERGMITKYVTKIYNDLDT